MSKNNRFIEGVILGAAVGAVAALLLAPRSGRETREKLKEFSKDAAKSIKDKVKEKVENPETMVHKTLEAIEQGFGKVSAMVDSSRSSRRRSLDQE